MELRSSGKGPFTTEAQRHRDTEDTEDTEGKEKQI
jgi:hypothetical protein